MYLTKNLLSYIFILTIIFLLTECRAGKERNYEYFPDMAYSVPYDAFAPISKAIFKDGKTSQRPVKGTIPRGLKVYHFPDRGRLSIIHSEEDKNLLEVDFGEPETGGVDYAGKRQDAEKAGEELTNPIPLNEKTLARGKVIFERICAVCHGYKGKGDGPISTKFGTQNLTTEPFITYPAGRIFFVVTRGGPSIMPSYATQIAVDDRWKVIHYVQKVIQNR